MGISLVYHNDTNSKCSSDLSIALFDITHTGQDSNWFASSDGRRLKTVHYDGVVDILGSKNDIHGSSGIGANSAKQDTRADVSYCPKLGKFAVAFDGYLINGNELREKYGGKSDGELAARFIANTNDFQKGMKNLIEEGKGSFCLVASTEKGEAYAARSPSGKWPLVYGEGERGKAVVTESRALDHIDMKRVRDLCAGELAVIDGSGMHTIEFIEGKRDLCTFLWAYYGMIDSVFEDIPVDLPRERVSEILAGLFGEQYVDIVTSIPNSGNPYGEWFAIKIKRPYLTCLPKFEYAGRSYDRSRQEERDKIAEVKLNSIRRRVQNKILAVLDDSVRRGTQLIKPKGPLGLLKSAGAKEIHLRLGSPRNVKYCRFKSPDGDRYEDEKLAANRFPTDEGLAYYLGIDSVGFPGVDDFVEAIIGGSKLKREDMCLGCYTGEFRI